jgi:hypothetical protein
MFIPSHKSPPVPWDWRAAGQQSTFRWIERLVPDVPKISLAEQWICLPHALKHRRRSDPERDAQADSPPGAQTERETDGGQHRDKHQFAIAAKDLVWPVRRLVDHDLSRPVASLHVLLASGFKQPLR